MYGLEDAPNVGRLAPITGDWQISSDYAFIAFLNDGLNCTPRCSLIKRLVLQVYLGSNTLEFSAMWIKALFIGFSKARYSATRLY